MGYAYSMAAGATKRSGRLFFKRLGTKRPLAQTAMRNDALSRG
jgi:hypothetical protein